MGWFSNLSNCHEIAEDQLEDVFDALWKEQAPRWSQFWDIQVYIFAKIVKIWTTQIWPTGWVHWMCSDLVHMGIPLKRIISSKPILSQVTHLASCLNSQSGSRYHYCVHVKFVWLSWKLERTSLRMFLIHCRKNRLLAEANFEISKFLDLQKFCKFQLKFHPMEWSTGCVLTSCIWEYHWKKSFEEDQSCHRSPTLLPVWTHILDATIGCNSNMSNCHENWRGQAWGCFWYTMKKTDF